MNTSTEGVFAKLYNNQKKIKSFAYNAEKLLKIWKVNVLTQYITPEDIVYEIITKVMSGRIRWNRETTPDVNKFMHLQVKGFVSNLKRKERNKQISYRYFYNYLPRKRKTKPTYDEDVYSELPSITNEEVLHEHYIKDTVNVLKKELEQDTTAYLVLELKLLGYSNLAVANELKISIEDVERAMKRINRKIKKIAENINQSR